MLNSSKKVEMRVTADRLKMGKRDPDAFRRGATVQYLKAHGRKWLIGKVEVINIDGILFRLIDTAGIRESRDEIEAIGVGKSLEKMK